MTETIETPVAPAAPAAVTPVAPQTETAVPAVPRRVIGSDAEAALKERHAKAQGEAIFYAFRGAEYRLLSPMPAAFMVHAGSIQSRDSEDVDMREFKDAIKSAFVGEDGDNFVKQLMDTKQDIPADAEFMSSVLGEIVEAVSGRPSTN